MFTEADMIFEQTNALEIMDAGEGYIVYDESRDRVHFLNATAAIIYELCKGGCALSDIAQHLGEGFALGPPPLDDVRRCLESLEAEELVRRRP